MFDTIWGETMTDAFFQNLIDAMPGNIAIVEESGRIIYTNKAWVEFSLNNSGRNKHTNKGANYFTVVDAAAQDGDEFAQKINFGIKDILSKKISCFELEYPCHSKDKYRWFIVTIQEINSYTPRLILFSHHNITQLVEREEKVLEAQHLEAIGQLSGGIAHDFNNLLGIVLGNIELAKLKNGKNSCIDEYLDNSITAVERGASLVQKLLSYSRKQNLKLENIEINTFIKNTLELIRPALGEDIEIVSELNDTALNITVDSSMLGNAILNIAINARHAMPAGGLLSISTSYEELNGKLFLTSNEPVFGSFVLISISDTGTGIDEENIDKVFEPFFTTKETGEGSGLGLSMVYGFIRQSNGHIEIVSSPDKGTTVFLYLPLKSEIAHISDLRNTTKIDTMLHKTILLVEDNEEFLNTVTGMLEMLGCDVIQSQNGKNAIKKLNECKQEINVLLTDVIMPEGMSGTELAKEVIRIKPNLKVLLMSGYPYKELATSNMDILAPMLTKPFSLNELSDALKDL